jgi:hypothetical protein
MTRQFEMLFNTTIRLCTFHALLGVIKHEVNCKHRQGKILFEDARHQMALLF